MGYDLLCALTANGILAANSAANVANMNTPSYRALQTTVVSTAGGSVGAAASRSEEDAPLDMDGNKMSNVDAAREITTLMRARHGFEAALSAITTREEMLDEVMEILKKH
jgi:flagellar basal body rod protein FlgG